MILLQELEINLKPVAQLSTFCVSLRNNPSGKIGLSRRRCPPPAQLSTKTSHVLGFTHQDVPAQNPAPTERSIEPCQSLTFCACGVTTLLSSHTIRQHVYSQQSPQILLHVRCTSPVVSSRVLRVHRVQHQKLHQRSQVL